MRLQYSTDGKDIPVVKQEDSPSWILMTLWQIKKLLLITSLEIRGKIKMNKGIVCIEWIDSAEYGDAEWKTEQEVKDLKPMTIKTAGILVNEDDLYLTIASSINNSDSTVDAEYGGLISIPKFAITKRCSVPIYFTDETMSIRKKEIIDGTWPGPGV